MTMRRYSSVITLLVAAYVAFSLLRPMPGLQAHINDLNLPAATSVNLTWPSSGQAAVGASGLGLLVIHGQQTPVPSASVIKVLTALAVLNQKPLSPGQAGPDLVMGADDVANYDSYLTKGGSVVRVKLGEHLSEYQALEAMLLPSANNMATSLATWGFSNVNNFLSYANHYATTLGMGSTHLADASGFSPKTVSSAEDLVKLGLAAMKNPILSQIVAENHAKLPVVGEVKNTNWLLGADGVIGIKTGNTNQAGGCYLFAATRDIGGQPVTIIGAVMGVQTIQKAISSSDTLLRSAIPGFKLVTAVKAGQQVGDYAVPWAQPAGIRATKDLSFITWQGMNLSQVANLDKLVAPKNSGDSAGKVGVTNGDITTNTPVVLSSPIPRPSLTWRLLHGF